jgi:DNA/RNA endonuclease G (NUC1)
MIQHFCIDPNNWLINNNAKNLPIATGFSWHLTPFYTEHKPVIVQPEVLTLNAEQQKISFNWEIVDSSRSPQLSSLFDNLFLSATDFFLGGEPAQALAPDSRLTNSNRGTTRSANSLSAQQYALLRSRISQLQERERIAISRTIDSSYKQQILVASTLYNWDRQVNSKDGSLDAIYAPAPDLQTQERLRTRTDISEIELFVSVFPKKQGLVAFDWRPDERAPEGVDYNAERIFQAKWKRDYRQKTGIGTWTWTDSAGKISQNNGYSYEITLPPDRALTAGQKYYFTVNLKKSDGNNPTSQTLSNTYFLVNPGKLPTTETNTFPSVTLMNFSHDDRLSIEAYFDSFALGQMAVNISETGGTLLRYDPRNNLWNMADFKPDVNTIDRPDYYGLIWQHATTEKLRQIDKKKHLVILFSPERREIDRNSGFAEADADAFYTALVKLDEIFGGSVSSSYTAGKLDRTQGALFNSPLHFIGFDRGNIVNSEVVQRLGTFYPLAGGKDAATRDLQMTSISLPGDTSSILDPTYTIWNNVTYADNYYFDNSPAGSISSKSVRGVDWDVNLKGLAGFEADSDRYWNANMATLAWYLGTTDVNQSTVSRRVPIGSDWLHMSTQKTERIYRRLGDLYKNGSQVYQNSQTWYTPDHTAANFGRGDTSAVWEGIGTGWFHSILGGGYRTRPYRHDTRKVSRTQLGSFDDYLKTRRTDISIDNTNPHLGGSLRGDYAVPTLFNGNFDAITHKFDSQWIPGWAAYNSNNQWISYSVDTPSQENLAYGIAGNQTFSLKLSNSLSSVTHNRFVVPDWGDLFFDIHAPVKSGKLKVSIESESLTAPISTTIDLDTDATIPLDEDGNIDLDPATPDNTIYRQLTDIYQRTETQIGYGRTGFETFQLKLHSAAAMSLRGKLATVKFSMENGSHVYLDNIFFKSNHLSLGNITEARWDTNPHGNNLLLEKPQYVVSYNESRKNPNWAAWKIDRTWLSSQARPEAEFFADPNLPSSFSSYNGDVFNSVKMDRGHLTPNGDRSRNLKDALSTFLTTNVIPQALDNNRFFVDPRDLSAYPQNFIEGSAWFNLERNIRNQVLTNNKQYYIIDGAFGNNETPQKATNVPYLLDKTFNGQYINRGDTSPSFLQYRGINIPNWTWKVISPVDINNKPIGAFAYLTPRSVE